MKPVEYRKQVLAALQEVVCKDRAAVYSDAEDNFAHIAARWSLYLNQRFGIGIKVASADVAALMMDVKISRIAATPLHADSWLDAAGYGVCGAGIVGKMLAETKAEGPIKPPVGQFPQFAGVRSERYKDMVNTPQNYQDDEARERAGQ